MGSCQKVVKSPGLLYECAFEGFRLSRFRYYGIVMPLKFVAYFDLLVMRNEFLRPLIWGIEGSIAMLVPSLRIFYLCTPIFERCMNMNNDRQGLIRINPNTGWDQIFV